jgi:hypothetical protein
MITMLLLSLAGCATTSQYGNHLKATAVDQQQLAGEALNQLTALWLPAKTEFELRQATPDVFGMALVKAMRDRGYAVHEFNPEVKNKSVEASQALPLRYVLDEAVDLHLYRLTLTVGLQSITRAYQEQAGTLVPVSQWARKE